MDTGGIFRCEVSNEFPDFDTVTTAEILSVVGERKYLSELQSRSAALKQKFNFPAIPRGPVLGQVPVSGLPGDKVNVSCSLLGSLPAPSLTWSVHNVCCHEHSQDIHFLFPPGTSTRAPCPWWRAPGQAPSPRAPPWRWSGGPTTRTGWPSTPWSASPSASKMTTSGWVLSAAMGDSTYLKHTNTQMLNH